MKAFVIPGEVVGVYFKFREDAKLTPCLKLVHAVHRGGILVPDPDSFNGFALVICHGTSGTTGKYWYTFINHKGLPEQQDVMKLEKLDGEQLILESFIVD